MKPARIIGLVVILAFALLGAGAFKQSLTPYVGFDEARRAGRTVQVRGKKVPGTVRFDPKIHAWRFDITNDANDRMSVVYRKAKSGNFDQAPELVVIGRYRNGIFRCDRMLVKCPSKYQAKERAGLRSPH